MERGGDAQKLSAMYREGVSTKSDFYAFLCFYKIIEAVDARNRTDALLAVECGNIPTVVDRHRVPELDDDIVKWLANVFPPWYVWTRFEIGMIAPPEARGKRLASVRQNHLLPLRNAIAHGLLDEIGLVDLDDPELRKRTEYWLPYVRMMARRTVFFRCYPSHFKPLAAAEQKLDASVAEDI